MTQDDANEHSVDEENKQKCLSHLFPPSIYFESRIAVVLLPPSLAEASSPWTSESTHFEVRCSVLGLLAKELLMLSSFSVVPLQS